MLSATAENNEVNSESEFSIEVTKNSHVKPFAANGRAI
jgi:hypothetical protein